MHELPTELTKSLRSWRGSVVRDSVDLEKAALNDDHEGYLRHMPSDMILHPTKSSQALKQQYDDVQKHQWEHRPLTTVNEKLGDSAIEPSPISPIQTRRTATFGKQSDQSPIKKSVWDQPDIADLDGAASRLEEDHAPLNPDMFYELIGMARPVQPNVYPRKFAVPNGLYAKIKDAYDQMSYRYHTFNILTYVLMTMQLLLSAVFVILGSLGNVDSHIAIAVLGAVSTVVAGALALMKGQGLPNRLRQGRDNLGYVLFEAQELWWDNAAGKSIQYKDIKRLRQDYLRVMEEQRRNHPDTWNSWSEKIAGGKDKLGRTTGPAWASRLTLPLTRQR